MVDIIQSNDFSEGWVTVLPPHLIGDGATPNVANVDFSESFGRLTKRKGFSVHTSGTGATPVCGLYEYVQADGDQFLVAAKNDDVYNITAGNWSTSILNAAGLNGAHVNFTTFNDLLIIVSVNLTTSKWTGSGSAADLLGTPPSNVKYIDTHKRRVFMANSSAGASRLHFSALDDPEDWTTTNDAGFIDIGLGDGDVITGIKSIGTVLLIFKNRSTWALYGSSPSTYSVRKLSPSVGCVAPKSIVACDKFAIFLSGDGVYSANSDGVALVSYNIKPTIEAIANATKALACAGKYKTQYWLAVDTNADGLNDEVYYLDYVLGVWGRYTNKDESVFYQKQDGTLLSGGSDEDEIRTHDTTDNDDGVAITMTWDTKDFDGGDWVQVKQLQDVIIAAEPISGKNLVIGHLIEGVVQATTLTFDLTPAGSEDKKYFKARKFPGTGTSKGRYFRIRLTNSETSARIKVYGYSIATTVDLERGNG